MARRTFELDQSGHQFPNLRIVLMLAALARLANPKDFARPVARFDQNTRFRSLPMALLLFFG